MGINIHNKLSVQELNAPIHQFLSPKPETFDLNMKVEDVLYTLQNSQLPKKSYLYVTTQNNVLVGIVTMTSLIHSTPSTTLKELVDEELVSLHENDSLEKALKVITQHEILALPVLNTNREFLGLLEIYHPEHPSLDLSSAQFKKQVQQDMFQLIGFSIELGKLNSSWTGFRYRMPWLLCNVLGGLGCALIGELYQLTLVEFVILALFIPLVLSLSESVAIQSMTISLRFLHFKKVVWSQVLRRLFIESKTSFLLGVASSGVIAFFYFMWSFEILPIIGIAVSIICSMVLSGCFGALFPILLHIMKLDPKIAAGPVVLTSADLMTVFVYLTITTWILVGFG